MKRKPDVSTVFIASVSLAVAMSAGAGNTRPVKRETQRISPVVSAAAKKLTAELTLTKSTIVLGEPVYMDFVVTNPTTTDLGVWVGGDYRNELGRPESFTVIVKDAGGNLVPQPIIREGMGGLSTVRKVPARGSYAFSLFLPHWATFDKPGTYTITVKRTLTTKKYTKDFMDAPPTIDVPAIAQATITIAPEDTEKLGAIIDTWGKILLTGTEEKAYDAARALMSLNDERVVPCFVRAFEERNDSARYEGLNTEALGRYNNDAAFQTLQKALDLKPSDIGEGGDVSSVHDAAAVTLLRSPHPGALSSLIAHRHDSYSFVRGRVVQALGEIGKSDPQTAIPILQEMTTDKNKTVREEAKRYLKLLTQKTKS